MKKAISSDNRQVIIAGGGPAGLTAAYELATRSDIRPTVCEASEILGGLSRTVNHHGNRLDIGGHRFFSKSERVSDIWHRLMPTQDAPALDRILLGERTDTSGTLHDPETIDRVMLLRRRVSRIYYLRKFFDYPVTLSMRTLRAMGLMRTLSAGLGYIMANIRRLPEDSLENFYINRFGRPLYKMFFEDYTEKVWGIHPSRLGADWGSQRVKGLSIHTILKNVWRKAMSPRRSSCQIETSLIEEFLYPKLGPGQFWETMGEEACEAGARINLQTTVEKVHVEETDGRRRVTAVTVRDKDGCRKMPCDIFLSSMPVKDLVAAIDGVSVPQDVKAIASQLPYRDFIIVGLLVERLKIKNETKLQTYADRIPDAWIYVQERDVRLGRLQVFNNWSPYLVKDYEHKMWLGLEYFCTEGDTLWTMSDEDFIEMAKKELESTGIIDAADVCDAVRIKVKKAYPAYFGSYSVFETVRKYLDSIENLYCIGRNGQHRYNNMDHSMLTAMRAADVILSDDNDKNSIWNVNTEQVYHETNDA